MAMELALLMGRVKFGTIVCHIEYQFRRQYLTIHLVAQGVGGLFGR